MAQRQIAFLIALGPNREKILAGTKTATIRVGDRDCVPGDGVVLCCHIVPWVVVADVVSVRRCMLREVTAKEFTDDGYDPSSAAKQFIANLKPYHPCVCLDSIVTVICFTNVRGKLADDWRAAAQAKLEDERRDNKLCPKCGSSGRDHEVRGFSEVSRDGEVYCKKCGSYVRYFDT